MPRSPDLVTIAPDAFAAWSRVLADLPGALGAAERELVEEGAAAALGVAGASGPGGDGACRALVDQFVCDVAATTDAQRADAFEVLGDRAFAFVQACYVADMDLRMRAAWQQLFRASPAPADAGAPGELWSDLETFMRAVARLDALDPLTTEIVRLRGARAHNCRLCQSIRSVRAARVGADESLYDQIDHYETSALAPRHQAALRLVDAFLWQPLAYPPDLPGTVLATFSTAECVELVLDVVRNAANKIAVAFAADAAHVAEGIELYDVSAEGDVVYLPVDGQEANA